MQSRGPALRDRAGGSNGSPAPPARLGAMHILAVANDVTTGDVILALELLLVIILLAIGRRP